MKYPTLEEIAKADQAQLALWYAKLPSPDSPSERGKISEIIFRLELGAGTQDLGRCKP